VDEYRNKHVGQTGNHWSHRSEGHFLCSETAPAVFANPVEEFSSRPGMAVDWALRRVPERSDSPKGLQRSARPITLSEVKQMQRTITEQAVAPRSGEAEPEVVQLIRADPRIRSVVTTRKAKQERASQSFDVAKASDMDSTPLGKAISESFFITDLLEDITYMVARGGSLSYLVFNLKDERVTVAVQPGSDLTEIAYNFAKHLAVISASN
jgi:hypothetical protein